MRPARAIGKAILADIAGMPIASARPPSGSGRVTLSAIRLRQRSGSHGWQEPAHSSRGTDGHQPSLTPRQ
jgi:hypothetical protein